MPTVFVESAIRWELVLIQIPLRHVMLTFVAIVVAVDLLGGAIHRRRHRRLVPPVRAEGQRHQVRLVRLLRQPLDRPAAVSVMVGGTEL